MMEELKPCPFCGGEAYFKSAYSGVDYNCYAKVGCIECGIFHDGSLPRIVKGFYTKQDIEESNAIAIEKWNKRVYKGDETADYFILPKPKEKVLTEYSAIKCDDNGVPHAAIGYEIIQDAFKRWQNQIDAEMQQKLFEAFRPICHIDKTSSQEKCSRCGYPLGLNYCTKCGAKVVGNG